MNRPVFLAAVLASFAGIALAPAPRTTTVTLPRPTLAATSPMAYEVLSWAFEDGKANWIEQMLHDGAAIPLRAGDLVTVAGVDLRARPVRATVVVVSSGQQLMVPRSALQSITP